MSAVSTNSIIYQSNFNKIIEVISRKPKITHKDLLTDCEIGLSTVFINRCVYVYSRG